MRAGAVVEAWLVVVDGVDRRRACRVVGSACAVEARQARHTAGEGVLALRGADFRGARVGRGSVAGVRGPPGVVFEHAIDGGEGGVWAGGGGGAWGTREAVDT